MPSSPHSIQLLNGAAYYPRTQTHEPPQDYDIEHVAYVLSGTFRFNAITRYSVAQHCVIGSHIAPQRQQLTFLMHDACEAYTGFGDIPSTQKERWLKDREHWIHVSMARQFRYEYPFAQAIHNIDARLLATEKRDLLAPADWWSVDAEPYEWDIGSLGIPGGQPNSIWCPSQARKRFLDRYEELKP